MIRKLAVHVGFDGPVAIEMYTPHVPRHALPNTCMWSSVSSVWLQVSADDVVAEDFQLQRRTPYETSQNTVSENDHVISDRMFPEVNEYDMDEAYVQVSGRRRRTRRKVDDDKKDLKKKRKAEEEKYEKEEDNEDDDKDDDDDEGNAGSSGGLSYIIDKFGINNIAIVVKNFDMCSKDKAVCGGDMDVVRMGKKGSLHHMGPAQP